MADEELDILSFLDDDDTDDLLVEEETVIEKDTPIKAEEPIKESLNEEEPDNIPGQLAVDMYETEDKLIIRSRTAGIDAKDLDVTISNGMLTISGTLPSTVDETSVVEWHLRENYWGDFSRTVVIPIEIKEDEVDAQLRNGILTISITKVQKGEGRKIIVT